MKKIIFPLIVMISVFLLSFTTRSLDNDVTRVTNTQFEISNTAELPESINAQIASIISSKHGITEGTTLDYEIDFYDKSISAKNKPIKIIFKKYYSKRDTKRFHQRTMIVGNEDGGNDDDEGDEEVARLLSVLNGYSN